MAFKCAGGDGPAGGANRGRAALAFAGGNRGAGCSSQRMGVRPGHKVQWKRLDFPAPFVDPIAFDFCSPAVSETCPPTKITPSQGTTGEVMAASLEISGSLAGDGRYPAAVVPFCGRRSLVFGFLTRGERFGVVRRLLCK